MSSSLGFSLIDKWLLSKIQRSVGEVPVRVVLEGGHDASFSRTLPCSTVIVRDRPSLRKLVFNPEVSFGDAYAEGSVEVEGDLAALLEAFFRSNSGARFVPWYSRLLSRWLKLAQRNSLRGSRDNIRHHYDLRTDFYKLWLDSQLVYTCAYFPTPSATLEEAQVAKLDYVCRKLQLKRGESVVETGCGWGALALHMAKHYGVSVKAFNISHEQILFARQRAREAGLNRQVEFIEDDYRNISGQFDAFVSVGMLEHIGAEHYRDLGRVIHQSLRDTGRGLLHFIGRNQPRPFSTWMRKRIFPGAYAPVLRQVMDVFEPWDFSVLDVENLRLHYAKTLEHWLQRYEKSARSVTEMFGPKFLRAWRLYLAGSLASFRAGTLQLFQVVFGRPACGQILWTRAPLYEEEQQGRQETKWFHAMS